MSMTNFDFTTDTSIENQRVLLRPLQQSDFAHLVDFSINEPELWTYSTIQADSPEKLEQYISLALDARKRKTEYPFIVFDKKYNKYVGSTRYCDIQQLNQTLQIGYTWYGKQFQGTGLNKNCKYLLLKFAFENLNIERVEFGSHVDNLRSIQAMVNIGCTVEGVLRNLRPVPGGGRRHGMILSILKEEWQDKIKAQLESELNIINSK